MQTDVGLGVRWVSEGLRSAGGVATIESFGIPLHRGRETAEIAARVE